MKVFLDTWVLIERYKSSPDAIRLLKSGAKLELHLSHITIAELVNVISRQYGEREALVQFAYLKRSPLRRNPTTEDLAKLAGILKTKYRFSLADAIILATAIDSKADVLITGGDAQFEDEWKGVTEIKVEKLRDFVDAQLR